MAICRLLAFLSLIVSFFPSAGWADSLSVTIGNLASMGTSVKIVQGEKTTLILHGRESAYQNEIDTLQKIGLLNSSMSQQFFSFRPITVASVVLITSCAALVHSYYDGRAKDLHVVAYLDARNDYGKRVRSRFLSFDFTKKVYDKIDWDNFLPKSLLVVAPNFTYAPWVPPAISQEMEGVGDK